MEVLGTVLGTAVQGQIVGMANAPCLPGPFDIVANASNSSLSAGLNASGPVISLDHTVRQRGPLFNREGGGGCTGAFQPPTAFAHRLSSCFRPRRKRPT